MKRYVCYFSLAVAALLATATLISHSAMAQVTGMNTPPGNGQVLNLGTQGNIYMTIDVSGNVGIGTTSPSYPLDVNGIARVGTYLISGNAIFGPGTVVSGGAAADAAVLANAAGNILFATNGGVGNNERMRITSGGNVGIGITNPAATLHVNGTVLASAYFHSSDERLKTDIRPIDHALDKVLALKGVEFNWKKDGRPDIGLTAQNVEQVFPNIVQKGSDGMKSVEYDSLVAPMIEALRELKMNNDQLTATQKATEIENSHLENENKQLESEIADIKKSLIALKTVP